MRHHIRVISRALARRGGRIGNELFEIANTYVNAYKNLNYDPKTNGEYLVLDRMAAQDIKIVFDVGANRGDYSKYCLTRFSRAFVHAFEILPNTYAKLDANLRSLSRVKLNGIGLSNTVGMVEVNYAPEDDGITSLIEGAAIHDRQWERHQVKVVPGDHYCHENSVQRIDLLKIDVEGAEHLVLEGLSGMLRAGAITAIQFEYGMTNIYSKFLLKDFWSFLEGYDFALGPIMPNGVDFKEYNPRIEDFQGPPNYFAVHASRQDIIHSLRRAA